MENKNHQHFTIKKIDLYDFLDVLTDLYDRGVDFIDITGNLNENQDEVGIHFTKEYMASPEELDESDDDFDDELDIEIELEEEPKTIIKLSDEDLNQLI